MISVYFGLVLVISLLIVLKGSFLNLRKNEKYLVLGVGFMDETQPNGKGEQLSK
jgi:hypothetical protein